MESWDLIIIGAGPAGLTAGIYGARSGLKTLVLEEKIPGGAAADTPLVENYPGFSEGISGRDLVDKMAEHCRKTGAEIRQLERFTELNVKDERRIVKTDRAKYSASAVIVASGCHYMELGVPGEKEFRGRGVSYCTLCDGPLFRGKKVIVIGGGNAAAVSAIHLANLTSDVKLAHRRRQLRAEEALVKDLHAQKVSVDGVFIQVGEVPNSRIAEEAGVEVDKGGYIIVDSRQRTNISGVYAAGDVTTSPVKQIGTAVGQAIIAATEAFGYTKQPYYYKGSNS